MKTRITLFFFHIIILMACLSWVSVKSRHFSPRDSSHQQEIIKTTQIIPQHSEAVSNSTKGVENEKSKEATTTTVNENEEKEEEYRAMSRLGSRPPNCGHKCGVCFPCEAVQIPATTDKISLQIANYEPEGWKCKCGLTFFNP